jgi:hypothetical protein
MTGRFGSLRDGSEIRFHDRGSHELKGVTGHWHRYAAEP